MDVLTRPAAAAGVHAEWDGLARAAGLPFAAPDWVLAWCRHLRSPGAGLVVVVVRAGGALVGVAPCLVRPGILGRRARQPGTGHGMAPLARPGHEAAVAGAVGRALAARGVEVLELDRVAASSPWPALVAGAWPGPGPAALRVARADRAPVIDLDAGLEGWLAALDGDVRRELGRCARRLAAAGATVRLSTPDRLARDVDVLLAMHAARWAARGGSGVDLGRTRALLLDAGARLVPAGRMRLWVLEAAGAPVAATVALAAGGVIGGYLGGFDPAWAAYAPSRQLVRHMVEDAARRGDRRLALGAPADAYKRRVATGEEALAWVEVVPRGLGHPFSRGRDLQAAAAGGLRRAAGRLPPGGRARLRRAAAALAGVAAAHRQE